jgi:hypothetical protein
MKSESPTPNPDLRAWMEQKKLKGAQVAPILGISIQTLRNWRCSGIPPRKREYVARFIADFENARTLKTTLQIRASSEQFTRWNWAALQKGKLIEEWAREGLDEIAKGSISIHTAAVAEKTQPYNVRNNQQTTF